jgi:hypothetical protein
MTPISRKELIDELKSFVASLELADIAAEDRSPSPPPKLAAWVFP